MAKKIEKIRHSLAHILAMSVQELYPGVKFGIGPAIENGFYYDFDFGKASISEKDLKKIEVRMRKLIQGEIKFKKKRISKKEAQKIFKDQPYKLDLIKELPGKTVSIYQSGEFIDLCKGPHVKSTKEINPDAFKLTKVAGAYWKGDENKPMLTRIYGLAFSTKKELDDYLKKLTEIEKRDHRKLGKELELFTINEDVGQGLPLWLPKGAMLRQIMEDFVLKTYLKEGYQLVKTPHIGSEKLFTISGHLKHYKDDMYAPIEIDDEKYYLKPMNCPFHLMIYKASPKSYRDLPIRYTELGTVYRYERSGTLSGLTRVRGFTQDDGHILCRPDQLEEEIKRAIKLTKYIFQSFGFKKFKIELSVRDPRKKKKYLGSDSDWQKAEKALIKGIKAAGWSYRRAEGEAVFYGPKIDVKVEDVLGRPWQISTIQLDFNLPKRFEIIYTDKDGKKKYPFMIHRALLGSLERFSGLLIEHYAGDFPLWLAPVQVWIIPISSKQLAYSKKIVKQLKENDIRLELKHGNETLAKKIRQGELQKIPYLLIIGEKEVKNKKIRVRERKKGDLGFYSLEKFIKILKEKIKNKK